MATGKRAFEGDSQASLIQAIMNAAPRPVSQPSPLSPQALDRPIRQALVREPEERWQSAGDLRRALEWLAAD